MEGYSRKADLSIFETEFSVSRVADTLHCCYLTKQDYSSKPIRTAPKCDVKQEVSDGIQSLTFEG